MGLGRSDQIQIASRERGSSQLPPILLFCKSARFFAASSHFVVLQINNTTDISSPNQSGFLSHSTLLSLSPLQAHVHGQFTSSLFGIESLIGYTLISLISQSKFHNIIAKLAMVLEFGHGNIILMPDFFDLKYALTCKSSFKNKFIERNRDKSSFIMPSSK